MALEVQLEKHKKVGGKNSTFVGSALWLPLNKKVVRDTLQKLLNTPFPGCYSPPVLLTRFWDRGIPYIKITGKGTNPRYWCISSFAMHSLQSKLIEVGGCSKAHLRYWKNHHISKKKQPSFLMGWTNAWKKNTKRNSKCVPKTLRKHQNFLGKTPGSRLLRANFFWWSTF